MRIESKAMREVPRRQLSINLRWLILILILIQPLYLRAEVEYEWAGFGSLGFAYLDDDSINDANTVAHNIFDEGLQADVDSRLGFQGIATFNEALSVTLQVVGYGAEDDDLELEWAYLTYDLNATAKLRIGRLRRPFFANSDFLPVGYVYPWARPPLEVYARDVTYFDNLDAIDLLLQHSIGEWDVSTEIYFGNSSTEVEIAPGEEGDFSTTDSAGIIVALEKDWFNLRLGYHRSPDIDTDSPNELLILYGGLTAAGFADLVDDMEIRDKEAEFYNIAANIDYRDWLFSLELVYLPIEGLAPDEESWYLMGGRRFGPWTVHVTYGERKKEFDEDFSQPVNALANLIGPPGNAGLLGLAGGIEAVQDAFEVEHRSITLGMRYDWDQSVSIKTELQRISDERNDLTNNLASVVVDFLF